MEEYKDFKSLKIKKIKSPKRKNHLFKSFKKNIVKPNPSVKSHIKKIKITPKKSKNEFSIPTELNFKRPPISPLPKSLDKPSLDKPVKSLPKKKVKNGYKNKTISVSLKSKEKDINKIIKTFDDMKISDIHNKLKSKGINTKNTNKNKLLKYIYLLTCVDDDINIIKG